MVAFVKYGSQIEKMMMVIEMIEIELIMIG